jgi:regulatory protein
MDYGKGEEFAFSVDQDVLIKFQLKKGMELDDFSFMEIQFQDDIRKAYNLAINYLAKRMRSEKEIKIYLEQKEIDEPIIQEILHKLITQKYINDQDYALAFVRTQVNTTNKGPDLIRMELKERGIKEELIKLSLKEYPFENQMEKAANLAAKFYDRNSKDSKRILQQKLEGMLLRKGYSYEIINNAVHEAANHKNVDEEMEAIRYQGDKIQRKYRQFSGYEYHQKLKQALYQKGFSMDVIEKYLEEIEKS